MSSQTVPRPAVRTWHHSPAWLWLLSFVICIGGDALLGHWVLLPIYVAGFYGGMVVIDLLTYPMLERWRAWLAPRGVWAWYFVEVVLMWIGSAIVLAQLVLARSTGAPGDRRCAARRLGADRRVGGWADGLGASAFRGGAIPTWSRRRRAEHSTEAGGDRTVSLCTQSALRHRHDAYTRRGAADAELGAGA